ncbi:MAG: hypothetical protein MJ162_07310 [Treponema sp.]|nr:hypothetical protein [Treponema sp.]
MAVRVADSLKQQNDLKSFPVAYSEDIWIDKNKGEGEKDYADLQELYNEGALGGSGLPTPEAKDKLLLSTENEETSELEWSQVDSNTIGEVPFIGTKEEWEALSLEEKAKYKIVNFLDDDGSGGSVDKYSTDEVRTNKVWVDGKPIYRKVVTSSSFTHALTVSIPNIKEIVNIIHRRGYDSRPNIWVIGDGVTNPNALSYSYIENGITISALSSSNVIYDYTGIIEYTKTN